MTLPSCCGNINRRQKVKRGGATKGLYFKKQFSNFNLKNSSTQKSSGHPSWSLFFLRTMLEKFMELNGSSAEFLTFVLKLKKLMCHKNNKKKMLS